MSMKSDYDQGKYRFYKQDIWGHQYPVISMQYSSTPLHIIGLFYCVSIFRATSDELRHSYRCVPFVKYSDLRKKNLLKSPRRFSFIAAQKFEDW